MYQIILYGTGTLANYLTNRICRNSTEIVAYVLDKGYGTSLNGIPILDISRPTYNLCKMSPHSNGEKNYLIDYV